MGKSKNKNRNQYSSDSVIRENTWDNTLENNESENFFSETLVEQKSNTVPMDAPFTTLVNEVDAKNNSVSEQFNHIDFLNSSDINFDNKLIIGIAGKKGTGKSTLAELLKSKAERIGLKVIITAFGDILKDECSSAYGFDRKLCDTQEGKLTYVEYSLPSDDKRIPNVDTTQIDSTTNLLGKKYKTSVRTLLQWYGTEYRRAQDADYWVKKTIEYIDKLCNDVDIVIVSDVRFPNEYDFLNTYPMHHTIRMHPYPGYKFTESSYHISETALDGPEFTFDAEWYPKYGSFYLKLLANKITLNVLAPFSITIGSTNK